MRYQNFSNPTRSKLRHAGFTLLEVLIALVLIGSGMAIAYTAITGSLKLHEKSRNHTAAMILARSKLDEILASSDFSLAEDQGVLNYGGVDYGFRARARPVVLLTPTQQDRIRSFKLLFEEVSVEVFWGATELKQSYALKSFRLDPQLSRTISEADSRKASQPITPP